MMHQVDTLEAVLISQALVINLLSDAIESLRACRRASYAYDRPVLRDELTGVIDTVAKLKDGVVRGATDESEVDDAND